MSAPLVWEIVKGNNSFLRKGLNGACFSAEAGNLYSKNSYKYSGKHRYARGIFQTGVRKSRGSRPFQIGLQFFLGFTWEPRWRGRFLTVEWAGVSASNALGVGEAPPCTATHQSSAALPGSGTPAWCDKFGATTFSKAGAFAITRQWP